jgi:hypothetical protein
VSDMSASLFSLLDDSVAGLPGLCGCVLFHPRWQVEDLPTPYLRGEAELRGEGRDAWSQCGGA